MKTKKELNALKEEAETRSEGLCKLTDEELEQVTGGYVQFVEIDDGDLIDISPDLPDIDVPTFNPAP